MRGEKAAGVKVLAGCGKTAVVRPIFDGSPVSQSKSTLPQDAQKGRWSHPPNPGAPRRALSQEGRSKPCFPFTSLITHHASRILRTPLADFFSIRLEEAGGLACQIEGVQGLVDLFRPVF